MVESCWYEVGYILLVRSGLLADERAVEFSQSFCRGDACGLVAELGDRG